MKQALTLPEAELELQPLVREAIRKLLPYKSARFSKAEGLLLDANENAFGTPISEYPQLHRYPDPNYGTLCAALSHYVGVPADYILATNGSNEALDLIFKVFVDHDDRVLTMIPSYELYTVLSAIYEAHIDEVCLDEHFDLPLRALSEYSPKITVLCSPNNPTGNLLSPARIEQFIESTDSIVVVDEAYIECAPTGSSISTWTQWYPRLLVVRTLSKLWGLAGLRLGYIIGHPAAIAYLRRVRLPYNLSQLTVDLGLNVLSKPDLLDQMKQRLSTERLFLAAELRRRNWTVFPSEANFLLAVVPGPGNPAPGLQKALAKKMILVRDRSHWKNTVGCVRFTIGTREENVVLLGALDELSG
jgi:histidinol-phosphate aminotransferase